jgi:ribosomal protein S18 acetylase RimI-like enzyme
VPLPVLRNARAPVTDADLLRLFHRTERFWAEHLGEATQLDAGVAITAPDLPNVWEANRMLEAAVPPGTGPSEAIAEVEKHFASIGTRCWQWQMNPSAPTERTVRLAEQLTAAGYVAATDDVMALAAPPRLQTRAVPTGLTLLPARAAFRQARELAEESAARRNEPQVAEAQMRHLDDPHCDSLLALRDGRAVGQVTVLAVGDIGRIEQVYVAESARRQGIGTLLLDRAIEICARSLFRHVMLSVTADNEAARALYERTGFGFVGKMITYQRTTC